MQAATVETAKTSGTWQVAGMPGGGVGSQSTPVEEGIKLKDILRALRRRRKLILVCAGTFFALNAVAVIHNRITSPVYQGSFSLLIQDPVGTGGGGGDSDASSNFAALANRSININLPTLIEFLRSPLTLDPIARRFDTTTGSLSSRIEIVSEQSRGGATGILRVNLNGSDFLEDQRLLEELSTVYLNAAQAQRQKKLNEGISFLDKQAPKLTAEAFALQRQLTIFRQRYAVVDPTAEADNVQAQLLASNERIYDLTAEQYRLEKLKRSVETQSLSASEFSELLSAATSNTNAMPSGAGVGATALASSPVANSMLENFIKQEREMAMLRFRFKGQSEIIQTLKAKQRKLGPLLRETQLSILTSTINSNKGMISEEENNQTLLRSQFRKYPVLMREYEELAQKVKVAQENLAGLRAARDSFRLQLVQTEVPWQILSPPAMNPVPIAPRVPLELAKGAGIALLVGMGAGLLRDRMDHVFHHPSEVKEELEAPLLGHIPHFRLFQHVREGKRFILGDLDQPRTADDGVQAESEDLTYERFVYQESFRSLFTSLRFLSADSLVRAVVITSSLPAEGKSLVNILLAKTLSEMGLNVLLVDADLRKPQIHHRLGINNLVGLSNIITDHHIQWRDAVQQMADYGNWSVITAGRRPPDPTRLLSSSRMLEFVDEVMQSQSFDIVLFDAPPILGIADATWVAQHCDGIILLVSLDYVDRNLAREAITRIHENGSKFLGVISNSIKQRQQRMGRYGYGGYGYGGYGYGGYGYGGYGYGGYGYGGYEAPATYANLGSDDHEQLTATATTGQPDGTATTGQASNQPAQASRRLRLSKDSVWKLYGYSQMQFRRLMNWLDR